MGVHAKVVLCKKDAKNYLPYVESAKKLMTEYKVVDMDFVKFYNEIDIYGDDKVCFMMYTEDEMS